MTVTTLLFKMPKSKSRGSRTAAGPKRQRRGAATPRTTSTTSTTSSTTCTTTAMMTEAVLPPDNLLPPTTPQSTVASMTLEQLMNAVGTRVRLEMQAQSSEATRQASHVQWSDSASTSSEFLVCVGEYWHGSVAYWAGQGSMGLSR